MHKQGCCAQVFFDIRQQLSVDLLRTSLKKAIQYVGTNYGEDITDKLENCQQPTMSTPQHTAEVLRKHMAAKVTLKRNQQNALLVARQTMAVAVQEELANIPNQGVSADQ